MKTTFKYFLAVAVAIAAFSCHKPTAEMIETNKKIAKASSSKTAVTCPATVLSGTYTSPLTLTTGNSYLLRGNVVIDGTSITIQPGVVVYGEKSTNGALIVLPDATISAAGQANNPIVFTSDQEPCEREAGDWAGVFLLGAAPNNQSNALNIVINGSTYTAGGTTSAHNSGTLTYAQIHFAGAGGGSGSDRRSESALVMASLGSATTVNHIQVSETARDGIGIFGGAIQVSNLFVHKAVHSDFLMSYGYVGYGKSLFGFKDNQVATTAPNYGLEVSNFISGSDNSPFTNPILSNMTFLGGEYCPSGDPAFQDAIYIGNNGSAKIYNSVVAGLSRYALVLDGNNVVAKTGTNALEFSYNSFYNVAGSPEFNYSVTSNWNLAGGCSLTAAQTMVNWLSGTVPSVTCDEQGNQFSAAISVLGYDQSSACGDKCTTFPNFALNLGTTELEAPNYDGMPAFFTAPTEPEYRGAFGSTSWITSGWVNFCAACTDYCL